MSKIQSALSILALSFVIAGCSPSSSNSSSSSGSSKTLEAFLMAGNEGNYAKAESFIASASLKGVKEIGTKKMLDMMTHNGALKSVEINSETDTGGGEISVYAHLHFKDDSVTDGTFTLVKDGGNWKVAL